MCDVSSHGCSRLNSLNISWCFLVTDNCVQHLLSSRAIQQFLCKGCIKVVTLVD